LRGIKWSLCYENKPFSQLLKLKTYFCIRGLDPFWIRYNNFAVIIGCLQIPFLVDQGYKVIAPDLRGFGESSKPDGTANYKLKELRADVLGLLDHLKVDK
jgi:pimeloyl-ACP methyl ester carboxylesterase